MPDGTVYDAEVAPPISTHGPEAPDPDCHWNCIVPVPPLKVAFKVTAAFLQKAPPPFALTTGSFTIVITLGVVDTDVPHASVTMQE